MKKIIASLLMVNLFAFNSIQLLAQSKVTDKELGVETGGFTNFPANKNFLTDNIKGVLYLAPYFRAGRHELFAGIAYPASKTNAVVYEGSLKGGLGAAAGYKYFVFDMSGTENMFIYYLFNYLWFYGNVDVSDPSPAIHYYETDRYINNVLGLGYNLYFDRKHNFGFYYTFGYVISQASSEYYETEFPGASVTQKKYFWDHLNNNFGFTFKLTGFTKRKQN